MTFSVADRPMLIFVSDIHLTDALHGTKVSKADTFARFWKRIQAARGARPAHLCFVGDLFDLVRSPTWLEGSARPYDPPNGAVVATVERIVESTIARESAFFAAVRARVQAGELEVHYVLGNHDRLLSVAPNARRKIFFALTGEDRDVAFPSEASFPEHGVIAYHGHVGDPINQSPDGAATIGDAIGCELILRFPAEVRHQVEDVPAQIEDIDDVRPIYAVPAWVRSQGIVRRDLLRPVQNTWAALVEDFFARPFVKEWLKDHRRPFVFDTGKKLRLLLQLSTGKIMAHAHDQRLTKLYRVLQQAVDGKMAQRAAHRLARSDGFRFAVNGHSHFASMVPLGAVGGAPAVYFNTGTWRTVHQIGYDLGGRPSFLPYDAMSYLVFFPDGEALGRHYEWWNGALVARR